MKGLIIKDFYNIKKVMSMYVILTVLLIVYCFVRNRYEFIPAIPILIFSTTITSTFSMDTAVEWDRLAVTMVEKRKDIVKCKYILFLLIILLGILCSAILITPCIIIQEINIRATLEIVLLVLSIALCSGSVSLGFLYFSTMTIEKMELLTIFSYMTSAVVVLLVGKILGGILEIDKLIISVINLLVISVLYYISFNISVKIFNKRDIA